MPSWTMKSVDELTSLVASFCSVRPRVPSGLWPYPRSAVYSSLDTSQRDGWGGGKAYGEVDEAELARGGTDRVDEEDLEAVVLEDNLEHLSNLVPGAKPEARGDATRMSARVTDAAGQ